MPHVVKPQWKVKPIIWVVVACLGLIALYALALCLPGLWQPAYQGKSLTGWLNDVGRGAEKTAQAEQAIRAMGNRALPYLLRMMKSKDSARQRRVVEIAAKQSLVDIHFKGWVHAGQGRLVPRTPPLLTIEFISAEERRDKAAFGIIALGRKAEPAFAELTNLLSDPETLPQAVKALSGIGARAIPVLAPLATNSDAEIRMLVNQAFSFRFARGPEAKLHAAEVVPVLLRNLQDDDYRIRADAAGAFDEVGDRAEVIPALMQNLRDTNAYVRAMTGQALGCFGRQSKAAVPALVNLTKDPDSFVRERAIWALRQIDPEAAENKSLGEKP